MPRASRTLLWWFARQPAQAGPDVLTPNEDPARCCWSEDCTLSRTRRAPSLLPASLPPSQGGQDGPQLQTGFHLSKAERLFQMNLKCGKIKRQKEELPKFQQVFPIKGGSN